MGEPHKWAEVIKAKAEGKDVQFKKVENLKWLPMKENDWGFQYEELEFRIKPEPQYPVTRYKAKELYDEIYAISDAGDSGWDELVAVADAAIRRAIEDGDVILPNND